MKAGYEFGSKHSAIAAALYRWQTGRVRGIRGEDAVACLGWKHECFSTYDDGAGGIAICTGKTLGPVKPVPSCFIAIDLLPIDEDDWWPCLWDLYHRDIVRSDGFVQRPFRHADIGPFYLANGDVVRLTRLIPGKSGLPNWSWVAKPGTPGQWYAGNGDELSATDIAARRKEDRKSLEYAIEFEVYKPGARECIHTERRHMLLGLPHTHFVLDPSKATEAGLLAGAVGTETTSGPQSDPPKHEAIRVQLPDPQTGGDAIIVLNGAEIRTRKVKAAAALKRLVDANGEFVNGTELKKAAHSQWKAARLLKSLPKDVRDLIEFPGSAGTGYRLTKRPTD